VILLIALISTIIILASFFDLLFYHKNGFQDSTVQDKEEGEQEGTGGEF